MEKRELCVLLEGIEIGVATMDICMAVPQLKIELPYDPQFHFWKFI